jgi:pimeloyl-ACP methyl ester carboxylesterase
MDTQTSTTIYPVSTTDGTVQVTVTERGAGRPVLLLHGGAGPRSVSDFADQLAQQRDARVLTPVHPGFDGTPRPEQLTSIRELAALYGALLDELDLSDVTVVGNSIGGWVAAELALLGNPRITRVVLVDAVGLQIDTHPIVDFFSLSMAEVAELSYHEPHKFVLDVDRLPEPARAAMAGNRAALAVYGRQMMADPSLLSRLPRIAVPALVVWGASDGVVDVEHGRAYAAAIPGARLVVIATAGHLPQLETPERLLDEVWAFASADSDAPAVAGGASVSR